MTRSPGESPQVSSTLQTYPHVPTHPEPMAGVSKQYRLPLRYPAVGRKPGLTPERWDFGSMDNTTIN